MEGHQVLTTALFLGVVALTVGITIDTGSRSSVSGAAGSGSSPTAK